MVVAETVTTVGYGDVVPFSPLGRTVLFFYGNAQLPEPGPGLIGQWLPPQTDFSGGNGEKCKDIQNVPIG